MSIEAQAYNDYYNETVKTNVKNVTTLNNEDFNFGNFIQSANLSYKEYKMTDDFLAERKNERKYIKENKEKFETLLSGNSFSETEKSDLKNSYNDYFSMTYSDYSRIKNSIDNNDPSNLDDNDAEKLLTIKKIENFIESNPNKKIKTKEEIRREVAEDIQAFKQKSANIKKELGTGALADIAGVIPAAFSDPVSIASLFIPAANITKGASLLYNSLKAAGITAGIEGSIETINQLGSVMPYRKDYLGENYGYMDAAGAVLFTAGTAGILGGSFNAVNNLQLNILKRKDGISDAKRMLDKTYKIKNPDADQIEAINNVSYQQSKVSMIDNDDLIADHLDNFDNGLKDILIGKPVEVRNKKILEDNFLKLINDVENGKINKKSRVGKYINENKTRIREGFKTKGFEDTIEELRVDFRNKQNKQEIENIKKSKKVEQPNKKEIKNYEKKANKRLLDEGYNKEDLEEAVIDLKNYEENYNDIKKSYSEDDNFKNITKDDKIDFEEAKSEIDTKNKEQEIMEEFTACIIGE